MIGFYLIILIVIAQRVTELAIAKQNRKWILGEGGYEVGKEQYKWLVLLHVFFFISLLVEFTVTRPPFALWVIIPFFCFFAAQLGRIWAISSLGKFWNTKIMILPGKSVVAKGPYNYIRHPNYFIVCMEILMLPLVFQAYWTAVVFSILNGVIVYKRIKVEEKALMIATNYEDVFKDRGRFVPSYED